MLIDQWFPYHIPIMKKLTTIIFMKLKISVQTFFLNISIKENVYSDLKFKTL